MARVYLQMANYEEALKYADMALEQNDTLYDWISYYNSHKEAITKEDSYPSLPSATGYDYVENYYFRCGEGNPNYATSELNIPVERAESFEGGDARFSFPLETAYGKSGYLLSRFGQRIFQRGWSDHLRGISHQGRMFGTSGHR